MWMDTLKLSSESVLGSSSSLRRYTPLAYQIEEISLLLNIQRMDARLKLWFVSSVTERKLV